MLSSNAKQVMTAYNAAARTAVMKDHTIRRPIRKHYDIRIDDWYELSQWPFAQLDLQNSTHIHTGLYPLKLYLPT